MCEWYSRGAQSWRLRQSQGSPHLPRLHHKNLQHPPPEILEFYNLHVVQSIHQRIIKIAENSSHGGDIDLSSSCCQRHQCQYLLKNSIWKVLIRYTHDHVRFWTTYWSASESFWRLCTGCFTYSRGDLDWCRRRYHFFSLFCRSVMEKISQIPFLIICSRNLINRRWCYNY